jgi:hypothetical protein
MGTARDEHQGAASAALQAIGALQDAVAVVSDRSETALLVLAAAVGQSEQESARNTVAFMGEIHSRAEEMYRFTENAKAELERYASGF